MGSSICRTFFWETQIPADTEVRATPQTNRGTQAKYTGSIHIIFELLERLLLKLFCVELSHSVEYAPGIGLMLAAAESPLR